MISKLAVLCLVALCLTAGRAFSDDLRGEVGLGIGPTFPQGEFARYSDPGPHFNIRVTPRIPGVESVAGWIDLNGTLFSSEETPVFITVEDFLLDAKKTVSEYAFSLHTGLQVGSASAKGFIRPRAALAPGLYIFNTETSIRVIGDDEDLVSNNDSDVRVGWRGIIGVDFFFSQQWGISFDFFYDHVFRMRRLIDTDEAGNTVEIFRPARFQTYVISAVIPFGSM
jgi:hypothetical protein